VNRRFDELANSNKERLKITSLMHTCLKSNLAQNIVVFQRLAGMDNELPYTGHALSDGSTITVRLQLGHLMGWTFTIISQNTPTFSRG
jgi:hypothetical protein